MTQKYTQQNIDQFFSRFKELPISYSIEKVHQLINDPNAKATHSPKQFFKPYKLFMMTSALIIGLSALWFWPTTDEPSITNSKATQNRQPVEEFQNNQIKPNAIVQNSQKKAALSSNLLTEQNADLETNQNGAFQFVDSTLNTSGVDSLASANPYKMPNLDALCRWPVDTAIDKHTLFLYLTNEELQKLGVYKSNDTMYYSNFSNIAKAANEISCNRINVTDQEKLPKTQFEFRLLYQSNLSCTTHRWGHPFYSEIDTLIPIVSRLGNEEQIFWFNAHPSIFQKLPERYSGLESVYQNLICIKKKNPNHQIVNYWSKENNVVLDNINYLTLPTDGLKAIGFQIFTDSFRIVNEKDGNHYVIGRKYQTVTSVTQGRDLSIDAAAYIPPNPLPVIITDEKGLKQHIFGTISISNASYSIFDILIPVKVNLGEFVKEYDYSLIFWYYPTDEFVQALPKEISSDLRLERNAILKGTMTTESNCTYFEVCKSTLDVDDMTIYPNPANQTINVDFSLPAATTGYISLVNISGAQIKVLVSDTNFQGGANHFTANISDIAPGIYMVMIKTENGFKTQRLIVTR